MPIDRKAYHKKWNLISYLIRFRRAKNRCEQCGLHNYQVGYWQDGTFYPPQEDLPETPFSSYGEAKAWATAYNEEIGELYDPATKRVWMIILTVAHLDHDIKNNRFENLKALCQCCHLTHDRKDNAQRRMYGRHGRHHNQLKIEL